jgi:tellurium resistance protein TerD
MSGKDILDTRFEGQEVALSDNLVALGDDVNILQKDPALRNIMVAVGWDSNAFGSDVVDVDVSVFLLNHKDMTRVNEDFIFYNNPEALDGSVVHGGDSLTGAGDGDDESILIDLHGLPFDISRAVFVCSIYKGAERDQGLGLIRNSYIRLVNRSNNHEILRFNLDEHFAGQFDTAAIIASINREGPKWHFTPLMERYSGGLGEVAKKYGMVITAQ